MKRILVNLKQYWLEEIDGMVKLKIYRSRSAVIRDAIRLLIEKKKLEEVEKKLKK